MFLMFSINLGVRWIISDNASLYDLYNSLKRRVSIEMLRQRAGFRQFSLACDSPPYPRWVDMGEALDTTLQTPGTNSKK